MNAQRATHDEEAAYSTVIRAWPVIPSSDEMPPRLKADLQRFHDEAPRGQIPLGASRSNNPPERKSESKTFDRHGAEVRVTLFSVRAYSGSGRYSYRIWVLYPSDGPTKFVRTCQGGSRKTIFFELLGDESREELCAIRLWRNPGEKIIYCPSQWTAALERLNRPTSRLDQTTPQTNPPDTDSSSRVGEIAPHSLRSDRTADLTGARWLFSPIPVTSSSPGGVAGFNSSSSAMHTRQKRLAEPPNSRDHTTRASKAARTSGPSNVRGSGDGKQRHTNGDTHGQNVHQIRVKTENGSNESSSEETDSEESGDDESDTDSNDPEEEFRLEIAPTRNTRTVDRRVIFCFVGHSDDLNLEMGFTPRGQQPGAELFEKAKEYFKTQPDVLYCRADFEKRLYAFSKDSLEDVDRRINLLEISATNIIGGGQVFVGRDLKLLKRKA